HHRSGRRGPGPAGGGRDGRGRPAPEELIAVRRPIEGLHGRRWSGRALLVAAVTGLWLLAAGAPAAAPALLRDSDPAAGASLDQAPRRVVLSFTERPEVGLSSIQVLDTGGQRGGQGPAAPRRE